MNRFLTTETYSKCSIVIDLNAIIAYSSAKSFDLRMVTVIYLGTTSLTLEMTFEEFDKIFKAYQLSK